MKDLTPIAERARAGNVADFEELLRELEQPLYLFAVRIVRDRETAYDVLQQSYLDMYKAIGTLREPSRVREWCYSITYRRAIQSSSRPSPSLPEAGPQSAADLAPIDLLIQEEGAEQVRSAVAQLPADHAAALHLFHLEEWSVQQIAETLRVPVGTVKSRLHYARNQLSGILSPRRQPED